MTGSGLSLSAVKLTLRAGHRSSGTDDLADSDEDGLRERSVLALRDGSCVYSKTSTPADDSHGMDDGDTAWTAD